MWRSRKYPNVIKKQYKSLLGLWEKKPPNNGVYETLVVYNTSLNFFLKFTIRRNLKITVKQLKKIFFKLFVIFFALNALCIHRCSFFKHSLFSHKTPPNSAPWPLRFSSLFYYVKQLYPSGSLKFSCSPLSQISNIRVQFWSWERGRWGEGGSGQLIWTKHVFLYLLSHHVSAIGSGVICDWASPPHPPTQGGPASREAAGAKRCLLI